MKTYQEDGYLELQLFQDLAQLDNQRAHLEQITMLQRYLMAMLLPQSGMPFLLHLKHLIVVLEEFPSEHQIPLVLKQQTGGNHHYRGVIHLWTPLLTIFLSWHRTALTSHRRSLDNCLYRCLNLSMPLLYTAHHLHH